MDEPSLRALIQFLRARGVRQFALNGATGEFPLTTPAQLQSLLAIVGDECGSDATVLCGVGAAGVAQSAALCSVAASAAVAGLLLPMPYFFPYAQQDLAAFCTAVAKSTSLPILLYNLPQFTSGLDPDTVCSLLRAVPNIVGVKDSSGSLEIVRALTTHAPDALRIIGNDAVLADAISGQLCDGVVSGVACALPELIAALYADTPGTDAFRQHTELLSEFIEQLNTFPTPWGLKLAVQAQGVLRASFAQPLSEGRHRQSEQFQQWLAAHLPLLTGMPTPPVRRN